MSDETTPPPGAPRPTVVGGGAPGDGARGGGGGGGGGDGGGGGGHDGDDHGGPWSPGRNVEGRYRLVRLIGQGGFGQVFAAHDTRVGREVAVKIVPRRGALPPEDLVRRQAVQARLRHPHILGATDRYLRATHTTRVMDPVDGGTLDAVIEALHPELRRPPSSTVPRDGVSVAEPAPIGWSWDEALALMIATARAVGEAHTRGVAHLDLKPDNVMWMAHDRSPRVIDWDLAWLYDEDEADPGPPAGAAEFMAPERRRGEVAGWRPTADVFALGAVLHTLLTGAPPSPLDAEGARPGLAPPAADGDWAAIVEVCRRALSPEIEGRPAHGGAFADALEAAVAIRACSLAAPTRQAAETRAGEADDAGHAAARARRSIRPWQPIEAHRAYYEALRRALEAADEAAIYFAQWQQRIQAVIYRSPQVPEPHALLARREVERYIEALKRGDHPLARQVETALRAARAAIVERLDRALDDMPRQVVREIDDALRSESVLELTTAPVGARVEVSRLSDDVFGRSLEGPFSPLGETPFRQSQPWGSFLVRLSAPGCAIVRLPVQLLPGEQAPMPLHAGDGPVSVTLPRSDALGPDDIFVPAGWFRAGGVEGSDAVTPRRLWLDDYVMRRNPVTHRDYIAFLDGLWAAGARDRVEQYMPGRRADHRDGAPTEPLYRRDAGGHHHLVQPGRDLDLPVRLVDFESARAYTAWYAAETGAPWRLPSEWEYEKAARGVDGRRHPWGRHFEPCLTNTANSRPTVDTCPVHTPTDDVSVYGVRWLSGNVRTWCLERWTLDGPEDGSRVDIEAALRDAALDADHRIIRGGAYPMAAHTVHCTARYADPPQKRPSTVGIRLVRSLV